MTDPECVLTTDTSARTRHHCWSQTGALAWHSLRPFRWKAVAIHTLPAYSRNGSTVLGCQRSHGQDRRGAQHLWTCSSRSRTSRRGDNRCGWKQPSGGFRNGQGPCKNDKSRCWRKTCLAAVTLARAGWYTTPLRWFAPAWLAQTDPHHCRVRTRQRRMPGPSRTRMCCELSKNQRRQRLLTDWTKKRRRRTNVLIHDMNSSTLTFPLLTEEIIFEGGWHAFE